MTGDQTVMHEDITRLRETLNELQRSFDEDVRHAPTKEAKQSQEYLLMQLSGEAYAYPVTHVLEILPMPPIVPVPDVPDSIMGVINFRGQIVSVTSIHELLGLRRSDAGSAARLVVTKGLPLTTGIYADRADSIIEIADEDVLPTVDFDDALARLLSGLLYVNESLVLVLNAERICESIELRPSCTTDETKIGRGA